MRLSVIEIEKIILKELGFELYRIIDHPHKLMQHYLKLVKASNEVARKAWNYLNDSYRTSLCVHYPPSTLAAGCIYLSLRTSAAPMPNKPWWVLMESSISQIHDICAEVLNLYRQPKLCLKDIKDIIEETSKSLKIELNFIFSFDELFQSEELQNIQNSKNSENEENFINNNAIPSKNSNIFGKNILNKDVNSTSSTVKENNKNENLGSEPIKKSKSRFSKSKSKSPTPKKNDKKYRDDKNRHSKKHKHRSRSRSHTKSYKSTSSDNSSISRSSSRSRYHRKNKDRKKRKRSSDERKKRKRSYSNHRSPSRSYSKRNNSKYE